MNTECGACDLGDCPVHSKMISLEDLIKRQDKPLSVIEINQLEKWIEEDWESHDIDRQVMFLIKRLLLTLRKI
jgi:hypothetical protein